MMLWWISIPMPMLVYCRIYPSKIIQNPQPCPRMCSSCNAPPNLMKSPQAQPPGAGNAGNGIFLGIPIDNIYIYMYIFHRYTPLGQKYGLKCFCGTICLSTSLFPKPFFKYFLIDHDGLTVSYKIQFHCHRLIHVLPKFGQFIAAKMMWMHDLGSKPSDSILKNHATNPEN